MNPKLYDRLKFVAQIFLPALGTLYFTLAGIWGLPAAEAVVGTIVAIDTFLGVLLHISTSRYSPQSGTIKVSNVEGRKVYSLELEGDPEQLDDQKEVVFKVKVDAT